MLRAAVIGASGFGAVHAGDLLRQHENGRVAVVAAVVRDPSRAPEMTDRLASAGAQIYSSPAEMFADRAGALDLTMIPTSIPTHAELTLAALAAGSHVFVEKPAAATVGQVDAMRAAAEAAGRVVAVGFQHIYAAETAVMKRAILDGTIGELRGLTCLGMWPRLDRYYDSTWIGRIHDGDRPIFDSPANNAMAHQLNMMAFLAGPDFERSATFATAEAELYRAHAIETADIVGLRLTTQAGATVLFLGTHASEANRNPEIVVTGTRGSLLWNFERLRITRADGSVEEIACETGPKLRETMVTRVIDHIEGRGGFICSLDIARAHAVAIAAMHRSASVHPVPAGIVSRTPSDGSVKTVVAGLDALLLQCFEAGVLPSEAGAPWGVPGTVVSTAEG